jgi:hypothetical protein
MDILIKAQKTAMLGTLQDKRKQVEDVKVLLFYQLVSCN